jgi:hypothetical protein
MCSVDSKRCFLWLGPPPHREEGQWNEVLPLSSFFFNTCACRIGLKSPLNKTIQEYIKLVYPYGIEDT